MHLTRQIGLFVAAALLVLGPAVQAQKPSFDVVSIKPSAPGNGLNGGFPRGDRLVMMKVTLKTLLQSAYPPAPGTNRQLEIIGGPAWIDTERYDVEAKADCSNGPIDRGRYIRMIQSLLEDRFQLKSHTEPREVPVYELVVAKDGLKIKPSADQTPTNSAGDNAPVLCAPPPSTPPPAPAAPRTVPFDPTKMRGFTSFQYAPGSVTVIGNAVQINMLMGVVGSDSGRPVVDKTNLKELFDFKLQFSPDRWSTPYNRGAPPSPNGEPVAPDPVPPLATAIQQLGLRLESVKVPIDVLVVESAQKPNEN